MPSRKKPERFLRLLTAEDGSLTLLIREVYPRSQKQARYALSSVPSDFGQAFRLRKFPEDGGDGSSYAVCLEDAGSHCDCIGFAKGGFCRHVQALRALQAAGRL